jgi:Uma2 family endonuclease
MSTTTALPPDRPWTTDDLAGLPDDGLRHELVDGVLLVSPAPTPLHQNAVSRLVQALAAAAPDDLRVWPSPIGLRLSPRREVQPDIVVAAAAELRQPALTAVPALVVEVLSPGSAAVDTTLKRHLYEQAGVPAYWIVDPDRPSLTVLELAGERYHEVALVAGHDAHVAGAPFAVRIVPASLVR